MQTIITSDDIFDAVESFSPLTMDLVRSWYALIEAEREIKQEFKQELERGIRGAIEGVTGISPEHIIIDLNQNDFED